MPGWFLDTDGAGLHSAQHIKCSGLHIQPFYYPYSGGSELRRITGELPTDTLLALLDGMAMLVQRKFVELL